MPDALVKRWDTSLRSIAQAARERGQRLMSPYAIAPEREDYQEFETYRDAAGTEHTRVRDVFRWAGSFSFGDWRPQ